MKNKLETPFFEMKNVIQDYPWGSTTSLNELFGYDNPSNQPQAELWMGAHPNGCSSLMIDDTEYSLLELIQEAPNDVLSHQVNDAFSELPFLFKILAADRALSIQVHPSKEEAQIGFAKENEAGISLTAYERNYKDPNHKPELVYALTAYQAMNGFRSFDEIQGLLAFFSKSPLQKLAEDFSANASNEGLENLFRGVLSLKEAALDASIEELKEVALAHANEPTFAVILDLLKQYQSDVGVFAPLLLNVITLAPGEAMYLDARTPHAYLKGTGLEVMANSDNVLRAGLTNKHIDVEELIRCTEFKAKPYKDLVLKPSIHADEHRYDIPVRDFAFSLYTKADSTKVEVSSAEVLMPLDGELTLTHENGFSLTISKGRSAFVPAYTRSYSMKSDGRIARVYC